MKSKQGFICFNLFLVSMSYAGSSSSELSSGASPEELKEKLTLVWCDGAKGPYNPSTVGKITRSPGSFDLQSLTGGGYSSTSTENDILESSDGDAACSGIVFGVEGDASRDRLEDHMDAVLNVQPGSLLAALRSKFPAHRNLRSLNDADTGIKARG